MVALVVLGPKQTNKGGRNQHRHERNHKSNRGSITTNLQQNFKKNQSATFFRLLFQNTFWFLWKPTFFIIRKLNAATNMFASTKGATEVIAATLQQTYSKTSRKNQLASFFRLLFQNTFCFSWKLTFFSIRKLNAAANMFASTQGATEVIAAALQQTYSKTSRKNS